MLGCSSAVFRCSVKLETAPLRLSSTWQINLRPITSNSLVLIVSQVESVLGLF